MNKDKDPTIIVNDSDEQDAAQVEQQERLKEKLKYKQALRENSKKIDHKQVRLNIQADALPSKTYFIMNALAAVIASLDLRTLAEGQQVSFSIAQGQKGPNAVNIVAL